MEIAGDISVKWDPVELAKVKLAVDPARTSIAPPPAPVAATVTSRTTRAEPPRGKAALSEAIRPEQNNATRADDSNQVAAAVANQEAKTAGGMEFGRKLSPQRMRVVIESLREHPYLCHAARKAGIHRKTLEYWLKLSKAGDDGYDIEWQE